MKGSDFPPQDGNKLGPTYPCLAIFYWQSITFTHTALRETHQMRPSALRAETSSQFEYDTLRTKFDTQTTVMSPTEGESDFLPLLVFFSG